MPFQLLRTLSLFLRQHEYMYLIHPPPVRCTPSPLLDRIPSPSLGKQRWREYACDSHGGYYRHHIGEDLSPRAVPVPEPLQLTPAYRLCDSLCQLAQLAARACQVTECSSFARCKSENVGVHFVIQIHMGEARSHRSLARHQYAQQQAIRHLVIMAYDQCVD